MNYLYIFEDGTARIHHDPTPEDYEAVAEGVLDIYRFVNGKIQQYNPNSTRPTKYDEVPKALFAVIEGRAFHTS